MKTASFTNLTKKGKSFCKYFWVAVLFQRHLLPLYLDEIFVVVVVFNNREGMNQWLSQGKKVVQSVREGKGK
jgi:hypothetical protein